MFNIGDKVKVVKNESDFDEVNIGDIGVVVNRNSAGTWYDVRNSHWDETSPLTFYPKELELVSQSREQVLENAVIFAQSIFLEYMQLHLAKGEAGRFKAASNFAFSNVMESALAYKVD